MIWLVRVLILVWWSCARVVVVVTAARWNWIALLGWIRVRMLRLGLAIMLRMGHLVAMLWLWRRTSILALVGILMVLIGMLWDRTLLAARWMGGLFLKCSLMRPSSGLIWNGVVNSCRKAVLKLVPLGLLMTLMASGHLCFLCGLLSRNSGMLSLGRVIGGILCKSLICELLRSCALNFSMALGV